MGYHAGFIGVCLYWSLSLHAERLPLQSVRTVCYDIAYIVKKWVQAAFCVNRQTSSRGGAPLFIVLLPALNYMCSFSCFTTGIYQET